MILQIYYSNINIIFTFLYFSSIYDYIKVIILEIITFIFTLYDYNHKSFIINQIRKIKNKRIIKVYNINDIKLKNHIIKYKNI